MYARWRSPGNRFVKDLCTDSILVICATVNTAANVLVSVSARLVLNTCIPMRPFTLEFTNWCSGQFVCCEQALTQTRLPAFQSGDAYTLAHLYYGLSITRLGEHYRQEAARLKLHHSIYTPIRPYLIYSLTDSLIKIARHGSFRPHR